MPYPPCTLCQKEMQVSHLYRKESKPEYDIMLPVGTPRPRTKKEEGASSRMRDNRPTIVIEGVCDWCSMLIAGYIESLRQVNG